MEWNKITYDEETKVVEGLPDKEGSYIFCFEDGSIEICELCEDCEGWFLDRGDYFNYVKAWMPIPAPYKEEEKSIDGYVSKDSLYRLLSNYRIEHFLLSDELEVLNNIIIEIMNMPDEKDKIVKHGHLIDLPKALNPSERPVKCSACGMVTSLCHGYKPKYCSNCGAEFEEKK